jgi:hypothetical protein
VTILQTKTRTCSFVGCSATTRGTSGICAEHCPIAFACVVDGCEARVGIASRTRLCAAHQHLRAKLRADRFGDGR